MNYCNKILLQLKNYDIDEDEIDDSNVVHDSTKNNKRSVMPGPAKPPIFPGQRTKAPEEKGNVLSLWFGISVLCKNNFESKCFYFFTESNINVVLILILLNVQIVKKNHQK